MLPQETSNISLSYIMKCIVVA